jgi:hypothetical protein
MTRLIRTLKTLPTATTLAAARGPRRKTAMARCKRILGDHLHARTLPGQHAEAAVGVATA